MYQLDVVYFKGIHLLDELRGYKVVNAFTVTHLLYTSIVPALRAGIIHNDKQWELHHLYL